MSAHIHSIPALFGPAYIRTAQVVRETSPRVYRVRLDGQGDITARAAMSGPCEFRPDDLVLVAGESPSSGYIIGILNGDPSRTIRTAEGAGARIQGQGADQTVAVHDADHRVIFEYHPGKGKSVVHAPEGDLILDAPNGRIDLQAAKGISCASGQDVAIKGRRGVRMAVEGQNAGPDQTLALDGDGVQLGVHRMAVTAGRGDVSVARAVYRGQQLDSHIDRARLIYDKLETTARRMWQRSGYFFNHVRDLCQIQTGRMRTLIHGAQHTRSRRTTLIAQEDVRIDGKKINLG
jgi:hypothetical protein